MKRKSNEKKFLKKAFPKKKFYEFFQLKNEEISKKER